MKKTPDENQQIHSKKEMCGVERNHSAPSALTVDEMTEALEQYYEAAGFADFYNRELKGKSEDEIRQMYLKTFSDET